ncbi:MAG TPA: 4Fe-4S dicluster domain-containing protein, partial [Alphaproteobacteria bacterium]|nr:4Fe-4S dicluster domain-containing protein [Alphaproteobacteria bacterium]
MTSQLLLMSVYAIPMAGIWLAYVALRTRRHRRAAALLAESREAGLTEPASLHPLIDPARCLGCATCVSACPEEEVLGLVGGKAVLVQPASCIGHGACKEACPQDAIRLVLGTERRGVEVPITTPEFETTVPGLFVAGELGGMGLIRNAIAQGTQAVDAVARRGRRATTKEAFDLVVVGAGPAGIAASLRAREIGLRTATLEQDSLGGTVAHYPRGKIVMTAPVDLPGYGRVALHETSKEKLLDLWLDVIDRTGLRIETSERVTAIRRDGEGFRVETERRSFAAASVLLCLGRRGTPRTLDIPGEEREKVVYRLVAPEQYVGRRMLVVGGGDSALEAAIALAEAGAGSVVLCYRGAAFSRAKKKNRERLASLSDAGRIDVWMESSPVRIEASSVLIETPGGHKE